MGARQGGQGRGQGQGRQPQQQQQQGGGGRPMGMVFVAVGMAIFGIFSLLFGLAMLGLGGIASGVGSQLGSGEMAGAGMILQVLGVVQLVGAIGKFVGIYGVMKAESWAFYLVEVIFAAEVLQNLLGMVGIIGGGGIGLISIVILAGNAAILIYVFLNQDYFGIGNSPAAGGNARARV